MTPLENQALALLKAVAMRFVKGGLAGMAATLAATTIHAPGTWAELSTALVAFAYAAIIGFFTGGFLAVEKYLNWQDVPPAPSA